MEDQSNRLLSVAAATVVNLLLIQLIYNIKFDRRNDRMYLGHVTSSRPTNGAYKRIVPLLFDDDDGEEDSNKQQHHK